MLVVSNTQKPTAKGGGNRKVNLQAIKSQLVKRGKPAYENPELEADILSLDPSVEGDAFYWGEARVNLNGDPKKVQAEKMKYRNRALSVAERCNRSISIHWTEDGEMVIALSPEDAPTEA